MQPILVPTIPIDELSEVTDNFGNEALIGEGSYGRVYYGKLKSGQPAGIKKLDASKQPDDEFLAQVCIQSHPPKKRKGICYHLYLSSLKDDQCVGLHGLKAEARKFCSIAWLLC